MQLKRTWSTRASKTASKEWGNNIIQVVNLRRALFDRNKHAELETSMQGTGSTKLQYEGGVR
jgi:hypothetical protein